MLSNACVLRPMSGRHLATSDTPSSKSVKALDHDEVSSVARITMLRGTRQENSPGTPRSHPTASAIPPLPHSYSHPHSHPPHCSSPNGYPYREPLVKSKGLVLAGRLGAQRQFVLPLRRQTRSGNLASAMPRAIHPMDQSSIHQPIPIPRVKQPIQFTSQGQFSSIQFIQTTRTSFTAPSLTNNF